VTAILAVMALNAHVVFSDQTPSFLKWDVIGSVLADGTSGSGSGSETPRWVWRAASNLSPCPSGTGEGNKLTCERENDPPSWAAGCTSGTTKYIGCD